MLDFYKPYTVKGRFFPILCYEDTPLQTYGLAGHGRAKEDARLLNTAYFNGVCATCVQMKVYDRKLNEAVQGVMARFEDAP